MRNGRRRCNQGFLLLEVILAVTLLAIGLFVIIESAGRCLAAVRSIQNYAVADTLLSNLSYQFRVEQPMDYLDQNGDFPDQPGFAWERRFESTDTVGLWAQTITVTWRQGNQNMSDSLVEYRYLPQKQR